MRSLNKKTKEKLQQGLVLFICLGLVTIIGLYILEMDKHRINADLYSYDTGYRFDYPDYSELMTKEQGIVLVNGGKEFLLEPAPLYYREQKRILLPLVMVACSPADDKWGKTDYFTEISLVEDHVFVENGKRTSQLSGGFLHDGRDLYVFLEKTTVKWQSKHVVLEPFSYALVIYNQRLELYPSQVAECLLEDTGVCKVMAETESGYQINLSTDILYKADGQEFMLFSQPATLKELE